MARILVIPDLHTPFEHPNALKHCKQLAAKFKVNRIICLGDEVDFHSFSRFGSDPDLPSPGCELDLAIESLQRWHIAFPEMEICNSNHTARIFRKCIASGIPEKVRMRMKDILKDPRGWVRHEDGLIVDSVFFCHGEGIGSGSWHRAHEKFRMSMCFGHLHSRAGIQWSWSKTHIKGITKKLFSFNVGCLIDPKASAFSYADQTIEKPVLGAGIIDEGVPMFFPLEN